VATVWPTALKWKYFHAPLTHEKWGMGFRWGAQVFFG